MTELVGFVNRKRARGCDIFDTVTAEGVDACQRTKEVPSRVAQLPMNHQIHLVLPQTRGNSFQSLFRRQGFFSFLKRQGPAQQALDTVGQSRGKSPTHSHFQKSKGNSNYFSRIPIVPSPTSKT